MLKLEKSGINMISDELYNTIPKFKEGEIKVFQMLNGVPNGDPDLTERGKFPMLFGHTQIPLYDRIKDPKTGNNVQIGVVEDYDPETSAVIKYKCFVPGQAERKFYGKFMLHEGNLEHEEIYEILFLSNYNRDNPNRNKKIEPLFYEIKRPDEKVFSSTPKAFVEIKNPAKKEKELQPA